MPAYYLDNINLSSYNEETLKGFVQDSSERHTLFYTKTGMFTVKKKQLYKINVIDSEIKRHSYKGIEIIEDDSKEDLRKVTSQIPNEYSVKRIEVVNYKIPGNNHAHLVVTYENDNIIDAFFKNDNDFNSPMLQTIIDTFLSNLN